MRASRARPRRRPKVAFVLGGGGHMGAYQVGMLRALLEREVLPGVVVGTSVGALDGAAVAADPYQVPVEHEAQVDWLFAWWGRVDEWIRSRRPSLRL